MPAERHRQFKRWLLRPPRPHGATVFDCRVSFLEVFYDLAYVAVIGQASHQLAQDIWIGFGLWWIYFDLAGRRLPRNGPALTNWVLGHFPIALSIVAAGAAIVSLIGHAHDARAPAQTAWLLAGAVALGLRRRR